MYKNLQIRLGELSFFKDFVNDRRGDLYPVIQKSDDCVESVGGNLYTVSQGSVKRLFCQFFPFATYYDHMKKRGMIPLFFAGASSPLSPTFTGGDAEMLFIGAAEGIDGLIAEGFCHP